MKKLTIIITDEQHKELKVLAAQRGTSIKYVVLDALKLK